MNKKILYTKIFVGMIISFAVVKLIAPEIFITTSPQIKDHLPQTIATRLQYAFSGSLSQKDIQQLASKLDNVALRKISQGVYAKENEEVSYKLIKEGEIQWKEYTYTINGKQIKIQVPADQQAPSQQVVEKNQ